MTSNHRFDLTKGDGKTRNLTTSMYEGDLELVEFLVEYFGSSRSDVVRTAIRALASNIAIIEKTRL